MSDDVSHLVCPRQSHGLPPPPAPEHAQSPYVTPTLPGRLNLSLSQTAQPRSVPQPCHPWFLPVLLTRTGNPHSCLSVTCQSLPRSLGAFPCPRCQTLRQLPIACRINMLSSWSTRPLHLLLHLVLLSPLFASLQPPWPDCFSLELAMAPVSAVVPLEHPSPGSSHSSLLPTLQVSTPLPLS